jgi:hypothetical protein
MKHKNRNLVAKFAREINRSSVQRDRKKDLKRGKQKHRPYNYEGQRYDLSGFQVTAVA